MRALTIRNDTVTIVKMRNKAFSIIEAATVLIILSVLAAIVIPTLSGVNDKAKERSIPPALSLVALEIRKSSPSEIPEDPADGIALDGLTVSDAESFDSTEISVSKVDDNNLILTSYSGSICIILLHKLDGNESWAKSAASCAASNYIPIVNSITGTLENPSVLS